MEQWVAEVNERERSWQEERTSVLAEVQRLKAEAGRMVAILAREAEQENYSQEKKLSLGQEVYSLQLVVEMRTGEVKELRQKLAQAQRQLEDLDSTRVKLSKATARLDDLQAQVAAKDKLEKQLSIEKSQLEMTVTSSNKAVERMSQNVEELQWRIRNNRDGNPACVKEGVQELCQFSNQSIRNRPQSSPHPNRRVELSIKKPSLFDVSQAMIEATTTTESSQPSPSSSQTVSTGDSVNPTYADSLGSDCDNIELTGETDSLDEGLGDISSENETVESPNQGGAIHTHTGLDGSQEGKVCPSVSIVSSSPSKTVHTEERERIPSRIGFGGIM